MLLLDEPVNEGLVARVTGQGYAPDLSDEEVERGRSGPVSHRLRSRCSCTADSRHDRGLEAEEKAREPPHS